MTQVPPFSSFPDQERLAEELETRCQECLQLVLATVTGNRRQANWLSGLAFWLHLRSQQERLSHSRRLSQHGAAMTFSAQLKHAGATVVVAQFKTEQVAASIARGLLKKTQTLLPRNETGVQI